MPEVGLEPTCPCGREILSLVRIPISPLRLGLDDRCWGEGESTGQNIFASVVRGRILEEKGSRVFRAEGGHAAGGGTSAVGA